MPGGPVEVWMADETEFPVGLPDELKEPPEPSRRRWLRVIRDVGGSLLGFGLLFLLLGWWRAPELPATAPDFTLTALDGRSVQLADYRGGMVVLNFWATWCGPCRMELPTLVAFAAGHPEVPVFYVAMDGDAETLRRFAAEHGMPEDHVLRADDGVDAAYAVTTLPTTVVVGANGEVRAAHGGIVFRPLLWWWTRS